MDMNEGEAKAVVRSLKKVAEKKDIRFLTKGAYQLITLKMGFIAHFNLCGFQSVYQDLREFFLRLQTSEYSNERDYNLREADRQEKDSDFKKWYGQENQKNTAWVIREIVRIAREHEKEVAEVFGKQQMTEELSTASTLAEKYGYQLVSRE